MQPTENSVGQWKLITATPPDVKVYLDNAAPNRHMRNLRIQKFMADMKAGTWRLTHQGIAFNIDGRLVDGQHRLYAQLQLGITMRWWAYYGLSTEHSAYIDIGATRTDSDAAGFLGIDADTKDLAIARILLTGPSQTSAVTRTQLFDTVNRHRAAISFAQQYGEKFRSAAIRTPVARAFYSQSHSRLAQFLRVLTDGVAEGPEDSGAVRLGAFISNYGNGASQNRQSRESVYKRTERAIVAFLQREPLKKIYDAPKEMFLIEGEDGFKFQRDYSVSRGTL